MFETLVQDVRYAGRWLVRGPGFALVAILSLGLGIGFNTAIFAVADALLLRPLPVSEPSRLVDLYTSGADGDTFSTNSLPDLLDYREQATVFEDVAGYSPMFAAVSRDERARLVLGEVVTGNYFRLLGVAARLGRTLLPDDDAPSAVPVVLLSDRYWRREFGGDAAALGRSIRIRGQAYTIVGVLDRQFNGMVPMLAPDLWVSVRHVEDVEPAGINESVPSPTGTSRLDRRGSRWLFAKARLKRDASLEQARASMAVVSERLRAANPQTNKDRRVTVRATSDTRLHPEADGFVSWIVTGTLAAVGLVLAIACANVAGMLLARASARQREISIRLAVGAGRGRLIRQLLTESLVLGTLGALVGVTVASWLIRVLATFHLPIPVPLSLDLRLDARVLAFTTVVAILTGIVAGLAPALRATRRDLVNDLKGEGVAAHVGGRRWSLRDALVIGQVAVTSVLLVIAGLLVRSLLASQAADVGFRTSGLAVVAADTDMLRYTPERSLQFWTEATRRVQSLSGVDHVALASRLPFSLNFNNTNIAVPGRQRAADEMGTSISSAIVSPDYFATLGVARIEGRDFAATDTPDKPRLAIINETMARRYWPNESAVGRVVYERTLDSGRSFEIIGVIRDHKLQTVGETSQPAIYFSTTQRPGGYQVMVARTRGNEGALVTSMRDTLTALDPKIVIIETDTMGSLIDGTLFPVRVAAVLVSIFGSLALLLAAIGLYGVIAFAVARRTREIGIRMAIGARPGSVLALVMRQGLGLVVAGVAVGLILGAAATRVVAGALYGISAADPIAWGAATAVLAGIACLANLIPARRAMRIDPVTALRAE
jgi:putative ABC transport system permease protein